MTHKGRMYGFILVYYEKVDWNVEGINWFHQLLLQFMLMIDHVFVLNPEGFKIEEIEEL